MTTLTPREVALRIQERGENLRAISERLRTWTKEGLLKPVGRRNPGTGRHLRYPKRALVDAAILSKLHRHFGIWAPRLQYCAGALDLAAKHIADFHLFDGKLIYLYIGVLYKKKEEKTFPTEIFSQLQYVNIVSARAAPDNTPGVPDAFRPRLHIGLPELLEFGIVINLSSLYERLAFPPDEKEARDEAVRLFPEAARIKNAGFLSDATSEDEENG